MTIRLLYSVGNDQAGAILSIPEDRAQRLIRTGYAEALIDEIHAHSTDALFKALKKEHPHGRARTTDRARG